MAANRGYEALVGEMRGEGKKIVSVPWGEDEWSDGIHFNGKGYERMARVWWELLITAISGNMEFCGGSVVWWVHGIWRRGCIGRRYGSDAVHESHAMEELDSIAA